MGIDQIKVGDTVQIKLGVRPLCPKERDHDATAVVLMRVDSALKGGLLMEYDLHGRRYWHESDVEKVAATAADEDIDQGTTEHEPFVAPSVAPVVAPQLAGKAGRSAAVNYPHPIASATWKGLAEQCRPG